MLRTIEVQVPGLEAVPALGPIARAKAFLDRIDPATHRRIKGLRLVTAYGIAALLGTLLGSSYGIPNSALLASLAGGFALWASVSEGQATRSLSARDLGLFSAAGMLGALTILLAGVIAVGAAIVPRLLSGPAELPIPALAVAPRFSTTGGFRSPEVRMGLQAAIAALVIVLLNAPFGLKESAWAITACTYVIAASTSGTIDRVQRRIVGTVIAVPLGLACLPMVRHAPILGWAMAAVAMIVYAMAMPERYDIACGAYAFTLVVTLWISGDISTLSWLRVPGKQ